MHNRKAKWKGRETRDTKKGTVVKKSEANE